jgi:hypothetical protein
MIGNVDYDVHSTNNASKEVSVKESRSFSPGLHPICDLLSDLALATY